MTSILKVDTIQTAAGSTPTAADLGLNVSGSVLQTVRNSYATTTLINSTSFLDTGLSITITPSSSSSKILVTFIPNILLQGAHDHGMGFRVDRDIGGSVSYPYQDTNPYDRYFWDGDTTTNFQWQGTSVTNILDTPSTTSAITYKLYARAHRTDYSNQTRISDNNSISVVIAQEIAG